MKLLLLRCQYLILYLFLKLPRPHWLFWLLWGLRCLGAFGGAVQRGCQGRGMGMVTQWLLHWWQSLSPPLSRRGGECQPALWGIVLSSCTILCPDMPLLPQSPLLHESPAGTLLLAVCCWNRKIPWEFCLLCLPALQGKLRSLQPWNKIEQNITEPYGHQAAQHPCGKSSLLSLVPIINAA